MYSSPSGLKPPRPLSKLSPSGRVTGARDSDATSPGGVGAKGGSCAGSRRSSASASVKSLESASKTTRAAVCNKMSSPSFSCWACSDEDAAAPIDPDLAVRLHQEALDLVAQFLIVAGQLRVENHQVDLQATLAPVRMGLQQLPDDRQSLFAQRFVREGSGSRLKYRMPTGQAGRVCWQPGATDLLVSPDRGKATRIAGPGSARALRWTAWTGATRARRVPVTDRWHARPFPTFDSDRSSSARQRAMRRPL